MNQYQPVTPPGVKSDRGRLILIIIIGAIVFGLFNILPKLETLWDDFMVEISEEFGFPYESRYDDERALQYEEDTANSESMIIMDEPIETNFEITTESNYSPPSFDIQNTNVRSNVGDEAALQMLQQSRQQIIDQMIANGQEDQIPMVLQFLDQMESEYR